MAKTVSMIGVDPAEIPWLQSLLWLLRHPDPAVSELTRQALMYLEAAAPQGIPAGRVSER